MQTQYNVTLADLAKEFYFKQVTSEEFRNNFIFKLKSRSVIDKRDFGYYCVYCGEISPTPTAFAQTNQTIFPKDNKNEIWIVNEHYDGCRGWE